LFPFLKSISVYFSPDKKLYRSLKNITGFYPGNIALYKQAFRHSSAAENIKRGFKGSNERLELLGDAILGAVISEFLFLTFPYKDEGFLTKMRSKIVSRNSLNQLAFKIGVDILVEKNSDVPLKNSAVSGDAFEAFIGAIFLDKGYDYVKSFILYRIVKNHLDLKELETKETDFKSKLIEWAQKEKKKIHFYLVEETEAVNEKQYIIELVIDSAVISKAQHYSKKRAEQIAAELACNIVFPS
jgi:ribonuclease-3